MSISCLECDGCTYTQGGGRCTITRNSELKELVRAGGLCLLGTLEALSALEDMSDIMFAARDPPAIIDEVILSMRPVTASVTEGRTSERGGRGRYKLWTRSEAHVAMLQSHIARRYNEARACRHCLGEGHVAMSCPRKGPDWERGRQGYVGAYGRASGSAEVQWSRASRDATAG